MGLVKTRCVIHRSADDVYSFIRNYGVLTEFVPNAETCELVGEENGGCVQRYRWVGGGKLMGVKQQIRWTEETRWDDNARTCSWRQIEGDYKKYSGSWHFSGDGGRTTMHMTIDYKIDHPMMSRFIGRLRFFEYGILNHCDYPIGTSKLEGVNNKIKVIKRKAYGFHDPDHFTLKVKQALSGQAEAQKTTNSSG